jgi:VCBS repeat-containing protein
VPASGTAYFYNTGKEQHSIQHGGCSTYYNNQHIRMKLPTMNTPPTCSINTASRRSALLLALITAALLAACGGGGGNNSAPTPPTASSSTLQTNEDTPVDSTLNASDPDGDTLTFSIVTQGTLGTASITDTASGAYTYTPDTGAMGTDSFTFKANDGSSDSNTATVTVTILGINDAPVAQSGTLLTTEDIPVAGTLLAADPELQSLTYSIVSNGSLGTATITDAATGDFIYVPAANNNGADSFSFRANDGQLDSNLATVTITIFASNDAPVAHDSSLTTNEDTTGAGVLSATDVEMQALTYSIVSNGSQGTATITNTSSGAFIYVPDPDANGSDTLTFTANDTLVDSNVASVTIDILPVNDPPIAIGDCGTTPQAQVLSGTLGATDLESPLLLTYTLADGSTGPYTTANGGEVTITDTTTGAFSYMPHSGAGGSRGRDTFDYRVSDPEGGEDSATETVVVDQMIMPLGDSITAGRIDATGPPENLRSGYRKSLNDTLAASGFTFDLVGSEVHGEDLPDFDYNHEGHGGYTASEIAWGLTGYPVDGIRAWLDDNPADIVLLHIGTNGLDRSNDIDVEVILDEIDQWELSAIGNPVTVILAMIVDQDPINPEVSLFNNNVLAMANDRIAAGDDIIIANIHDALTYPDDMGDQFHPNVVGYSKMAAVWFNKLSPIVDKCP